MLRVSILTRQTNGVKSGRKNFHRERSIGATSNLVESVKRLRIPEILRIVFVDGHEPSGKGNAVSSAGSPAGLDIRASWAAHRCAKIRAAIKKKRTDGNFVGFTMHKF